MIEIVEDIAPKKIASAYVNATFDKGRKILEKKGYKIISLEENARLRLQEGVTSFVSRNANWTSEGILYIPNKGIFLTKNSPVMNGEEETISAHRESRNYLLTDKYLEQALTDSMEIPNKSIPTERFKEDPLTLYVFGDIAEDYGFFLKDAGIDEMNQKSDLLTRINSNKPFIRQVWFGALVDRSIQVGNIRIIDFYYRVRGIKE